MYKVVKKSEAKLRQAAENKVVFNLITKDVFDKASLVVCEGENSQTNEYAKNHLLYYVISGELILVFDERTELLQAGDAAYVAQGTSYQMMGTYKIVIVNQPAYGVNTK